MFNHKYISLVLLLNLSSLQVCICFMQRTVLTSVKPPGQNLPNKSILCYIPRNITNDNLVLNVLLS